MPLIIITGNPCSGKTTRSLELKKYFENMLKNSGQNVEIISEYDAIIKEGYDKNVFYADSKKEKAVRSAIKSDIQRRLNTRDLLIFDGSNYIKGYRYEIYCMTKLYKTPQCTIHCDIPVEYAWLWNNKRVELDRYSREIFDSLVARYETPDSKNRWDYPLFAITPEDELMFDEIYKSLYQVKSPKPNQSTQCVSISFFSSFFPVSNILHKYLYFQPPLASTNYLYELDTITKDVINAILSAQQLGINNNIKIPGSNVTVQSTGTPAKLMRLRRQFLTYSKMQQSRIDHIATLFVQYLNKNL
ncbi:protein KTI12 homolog isoform X1 [Formica exsecta]|uniref:protein KTI12 homolog isoform X1 n=1 Tax=Formica exsecta TaxID=72781 RepID=UPI001143EBB4|nr:protein KTI12 homolog isoform X1 [Formica exsecta]